MTATASGLAVACDDGSLVHLARPVEGGVWTLRDTFESDAPLARVAARGDELLVCGNDGKLWLHAATASGAFRRSTQCLAADDRLRGAVFADLDPRAEGLEAATAGYDGTLRVLQLTALRFAGDVIPESAGLPEYFVEPEVVAEDTDKLHHLAAGRFEGLGTALVSAGYSGRVLVVHFAGEGR